MKSRALFVAAYLIFGIAAGCSGSGSSKPEAAEPVTVSQPETEYVEAERIPAQAAPESLADVNDVRFRGGFLRVSGKSLEIIDSLGNSTAVNPGILQLRDEGGRCPSEGFQQIAVKGDFFTIEQQNCGGMMFIDEYITFKAAADGKVYLHRFSIVRTDREDPDRNIPQQDLTAKDFGQIEFRDVELRRLYELF